jgi:sugar lactone lactonase YvrE
MTTIARFGTIRNELGEGPCWDERENRLLWCDIPAKRIHAATLDAVITATYDFPQKVGSFGLCESGRLVVGLVDGVYLFDRATGALDKLSTPPQHPAHNRLNDGKVGPDGAFWVGSMDDRPEKEPSGCLYRVTADGVSTLKVEGLFVSNGLAWSPDGTTMYHSDSRGPWIDAYDFDVTSGAIANRRRIATQTNEAGRPDGAACDADGNYWSAGVSAGCLNCFAPDGRLLQSIKVPVPSPTMPCFCGADLRTMVVTSLVPAGSTDPMAGAMLTVDVGAAGARVHRMRGC